MAIELVSTKEAAKRLGISEESVRCCMRDNAFPIQIGMAWQGRHTDAWNYRIYKKLFDELLEVLGGEK